MVLTSFN